MKQELQGIRTNLEAISPDNSHEVLIM
jgi:hypothetical protein